MTDPTETSAADTVAAELSALLPRLPRVKITPQTITQPIIDRWYGYETEYRQTIAELRAEVAAVTERAENAEAERDAYASEYHRLDSEQAAAGSYANRAENAEAEVERLRKANHDLAKHDLASMNRATATEEALAELRERIGETPGLGGYTIGCDGDDATQWPYVECNRCRHDVWTGRYTGSALNLADAVDQVAAHDCDKAAKLRNIITEGG